MTKQPIILAMGIDTPHPVDLRCRSKANRCIILYFNTPFFCSTTDGLVVGEAGDCIVHSPNFEQVHGTPEGEEIGFRNDWIHIAPALGRQLTERFSIPCNRLLATGAPGLITPYLREIQRERMGNYPFGEEAIVHIVEGMMLQIARQLALSCKQHGSYTDRDLYDRLMNVRLAMYENVLSPWTLAELAGMANLSVSYFSAVFKDLFGISPIEDLLRMRIEVAKSRLTASSASLAQIAEMCGFSDEFYFNRAFKQRVGVPPGKYRLDRQD